MAQLIAFLLAGLALAVVGGLAMAKYVRRRDQLERERQQLQQERRNAMEQMFREEWGTTTTVNEGHAFGGQAAAFRTVPAPPEVDTASLVRQLEEIASAAKGKATTTAKTQEAAMMRRAERMHQQLMAEVARDNREGRSRPSGPCTLQISYVDADGVCTTRRIAPYKSGNTNEKFDAWCETREARRTFFFTRIQGAVEVTTGRTLTRAGVFQHVHPGRRIPAELR